MGHDAARGLHWLARQRAIARCPGTRYLLGHIGCAMLGPLMSAQEVGQLLAKQRPSSRSWMATWEPKLRLGEAIEQARRALRAVYLGRGKDAFDHDDLLRAAPRLARYLHAPALYATQSRFIGWSSHSARGHGSEDRAGQQRSARQLRLTEALEVAGADPRRGGLGAEIARAIIPCAPAERSSSNSLQQGEAAKVQDEARTYRASQRS